MSSISESTTGSGFGTLTVSLVKRGVGHIGIGGAGVEIYRERALAGLKKGRKGRTGCHERVT
jgi:hypothetical protein